MKFKATFFSVTGFLVPGAVALIASYFLIPPAHLQWVRDLVIPKYDSETAHPPGEVLTGTLVLVSVLVVALLIGSILSELFLAGIHFGFRKRRYWSNSIHMQAVELLSQKSLVDLLKNSLDAREAFAYIRTSNLDLHWFAGRIRMIGASSLALATTACAGWYLNGIPSHYYFAAAIALVGIAVAVYRSYRFDQYINVVAASCYLAAISLPNEDREPTTKLPEEKSDGEGD